MEAKKSTQNVINANHPGQYLWDKLQKKKISQRRLGKLLGMAPVRINELVHGKRRVSATLALRLEKLLKIKAIILLELQMNFDLEAARNGINLRRRI